MKPHYAPVPVTVAVVVIAPAIVTVFTATRKGKDLIADTKTANMIQDLARQMIIVVMTSTTK